jgi:hypothetical protein
VKQSAGLVADLDGLEAKIHNPKAEVVMTFSRSGGGALYSPAGAAVRRGQGAGRRADPGHEEVYAAQKLELDGYEKELSRLLETDLARINEAAKALGLPHIIPAAWRE